MERCTICGKQFDEIKYCQTCFEFHKHFYSEEERKKLLQEYEGIDE